MEIYHHILIKLVKTSLKNILERETYWQPHNTSKQRKRIRSTKLRHHFRSYPTFMKITKKLVFHKVFQTGDLQNIVFTKLAEATIIIVTFDNLHLFVPTIIPSLVLQVNFNEYVNNSFTISFGSWTKDRKVFNTRLDYHLDKSTSVNINSRKHLIVAYQTEDRARSAIKAVNVSVLDFVDVGKHFVELDGVRYPKDPIKLIYESIDYLHQYGYSKIFFEDYAEERFLNPFISHPDWKNFCLSFSSHCSNI